MGDVERLSVQGGISLEWSKFEEKGRERNAMSPTEKVSKI